jgi:alkylated DNA repair dioxygenase AlkB
MSVHTATRLELKGADAVLYEAVCEDSDELLQSVTDAADWRQEDITLFGRTHAMPRLICWMGDKPYRYSGLTHPAAPIIPPVRQIRDRVERLCGTHFNGVLLNLYRDGRDSMGWHADDEASLGPEPVIASVSLGGVRRMRFKPKPHFSAAPLGVDLPSGSVLVMRGQTQANWLHAIAKTAKPVAPRINLTFRTMI